MDIWLRYTLIKSDPWIDMLYLKISNLWGFGRKTFSTHILSSVVYLLYRYISDPRKKIPIALKPPFLRPDLSNRHVTVKVSDNGIHSNILRSKVSPQKLLILSAYNLEFQCCLIISAIVVSTGTPAVHNGIKTGSSFRFQWKLELLKCMVHFLCVCFSLRPVWMVWMIKVWINSHLCRQKQIATTSSRVNSPPAKASSATEQPVTHSYMVCSLVFFYLFFLAVSTKF